MKNTIIKCVTALICVVAVSLSFSSGLGKIATAKVEGAKSAGSASAFGDDLLSDDMTDDDFFADDTSDATAGEDATVAADAEDATAASGAEDSTAAAQDGESSTAAASSGSTAPSTTAEIAAYYNTAINKVISSKAGFNKTRDTTMHSLEGGKILEIKLVSDMVNEFLGVGSTTWNNTKGKQENLSKASLTASDIKQAKCADNNGVYTITIALNDGASSANASSNKDTSPLGRSGLYAGKGDKIAFDYKNSENFHTAINNVENCTVEAAAQKVTGAKIVAVVDSKTGNLTSLTVSWNWAVELTTIKYTIIPLDKATGTATTVVKLTNVKW